LTLPQELTTNQPRNSFLFNAHADPPTATLQRIKALVTGSLPTFVDIGHNFGGSSIGEDSIIQQLQLANKTVRFTLISSFRRLLPDNIADCLHGR
jgi:phosphatidylinositol glycan class O